MQPRPALAILPVLLLACELGLGPPDRHESLDLPAADLHTLTIVAGTGAGDITIEADQGATELTITASIWGEHTRIQHTQTGGTLELSYTCSHWDDCAVDWHIVVPPDLAADLNTDSGNIRAAGIVGALHVKTGTGNIDLAHLVAPSITVETGTGDIRGQHLECQQFRGETGLGDLELELTARPRSVWGNIGTGDIVLNLPGGAYDLDLETGLGDVELAGVRNDSSADAALNLNTGLGDIDVNG